LFVSATAAAGGVKGQWFDFNDAFVSEFDSDDLDEEAFGGPEGGGADNGANLFLARSSAALVPLITM